MDKKRYLDKGIRYIGFFDIETQGTNFNANEGYLVSWYLEIKDLKTGKSKIYHSIVNKKYLKKCNKIMKKNKKLRKIRPYDREILLKLIPILKKCNLIVTHYGSRFDIPMIRTRCMMQKIPFIKRSDNIRFSDTWQYAKYTLKLKNNRLDTLARSLGIKEHKTEVDYWYWQMLAFGDKEAVKYVLHHNKLDVIVTKKCWYKIESSCAVTNRYY